MQREACELVSTSEKRRTGRAHLVLGRVGAVEVELEPDGEEADRYRLVDAERAAVARVRQLPDELGEPERRRRTDRKSRSPSAVMEPFLSEMSSDVATALSVTPVHATSDSRSMSPEQLSREGRGELASADAWREKGRTAAQHRCHPP